MPSRVSDLAQEATKYMAANPTEIRESVAVYSFLQGEFKRPPVTRNCLFQFVYRSFYRIDNAGLRPSFHAEYFKVMEMSRGSKNIDLKALVRQLSRPDFNWRNLESLQFSFVTKLAHTVCPDTFPIYDSEIARAFGFRPPDCKSLEKRLEQYYIFYEALKKLYAEILSKGELREQVEDFRNQFAITGEIPPLKIIDFIFWSAGKRIREIEKRS
jgi:hypothetical protein